MVTDRYITVTALTRHVKRMIDNEPALQDVWLRGELSNVKLHSRGHLYFTVKDDKSRVQSVMFAGNNRHMKFKPENGMKVLIRGEVSVFEPYGQYQLYAREMQPDGIGNLYLAYEELKRKLEFEGLFSDERKKPIPRYPNEIGVITSPTGAAIRDIFTTIKRRYPSARITVFPVLVQGVNAKDSIVRAIEMANSMHMIDVLIVGRGGGSIEELWAFNEEEVARSISTSKIPVISAVGHETDYTISDFVSDLRAPTPTGAAELAVPSMVELEERLDQRIHRLMRAMKEKKQNEQERLSRLQKSYAFRYPNQLLSQKEQELDLQVERLRKTMKRQIDYTKERVQRNHAQLLRKHPEQLLQDSSKGLEDLRTSLYKEMKRVVQGKQRDFAHATSKLDALSPLKIMERGYSLAYKDDELIKSVKQVEPGDVIKVQMTDGKIDAHVYGLEENDSYGKE
ncbi:exodeoxyribonuclease VII large subunit [Guptibacillus algicola]|uniref:exodeoxyribonuclease VII large subunit n=1 Tax=Guptibacillus algicola TaxID=225844 RepID=UPI001CD54C2B|nr:exodeoxyribonuclease VII large subunit [Alkalihalobacillus algicola]MCA0985970.1 exodeoxyribonuclease VII large subunit [Alkalihalobacillus algicola]